VADSSEGGRFAPLMIALAGALQRSHLHVGNRLNVVLHTAKKGSKGGGNIESAGAYSVAPASNNARIVIGDDLTFAMDVRWYEGLELPKGKGQVASGSGGGGFLTWLFGVLVGVGVCLGWRWVIGRRSGQSVLPKYNGYGYGAGTSQTGSGYGFGGGIGKRE
jgi:hypothetical protein